MSQVYHSNAKLNQHSREIIQNSELTNVELTQRFSVNENNVVKPDIGVATVQKLLNYFETFEVINQASFNELSVANSQKVAKILKNI